MSHETRQDIFNRVAPALLARGKKSYDKECLYRGPDNTKCAIGFLIPDNHRACYYRGDIFDLITEFKDLHGILGFSHDEPPPCHEDDETEMANSETITHQRFLKNLQSVHDSYEVSSWPHHLKILADRYKLDSSCIIPAFVQS